MGSPSCILRCHETSHRDVRPGGNTISAARIECVCEAVHMGCHNAAQEEDIHKKAEGLEQRDADIRLLTEAAAVAASEREALQADVADRKAEINSFEAQVCLNIPTLHTSG